MAIVSYGGYGIIPGPYVTIVDNPIVAGNQTRIGTTYNITLQGTISVFKGSPSASGHVGGGWGGPNGQFWTDIGYPPDESNPSMSLHQLYMMQSKQTALQSLFSQDGLTLAFTSPDGSTPLTCQPRNAVVNFEADLWYSTCKYTITMEADSLSLGGQVLQNLPASGYIQSSAESWQLSPNEIVKTFSVQHSVSAVGKNFYTSSGTLFQKPWQNARDYVLTQLVLGWSGISAYSNIPGYSIFQQSPLGSGSLNFGGYSPYNYSQTSSVDELAGSFEVTESWIAAPTSSGTHVYTVSTTRIVEDPYTTVVATVKGSIQGFYTNLFDYDSRLANATYVWNQLAAPTGLLSLVEQYTNLSYGPIGATGSFNLQPRQGSIDYDYQAGSISYQYEFSNQRFTADSFEQYTLSRKTSADSYMTSFDLAGSIKGRRYDGETDTSLAFSRAYSQWASLTGNSYNALYSRVINSTYFPEASGLQIQPAPWSIDIGMDQANGIINYQLEFNNRYNDANTSNNVTDEWSVSQHFSVDDGITTYAIAGEVQGLNINDNNPRFAKYAAATGYFYNFVVPHLYSRITGVYGITLPNTNPLVSEITHYTIKGALNYSYEFRSTFPPLLPGVLSEDITVSEDNYNTNIQTIGIVPVLGRRQGPIIQDMQSSQVKTRTLTIQAVLRPTGDLSNILTAFNTKPTGYDIYALQLTPTNGYCTAWQDSWSWKNGHYSLNVSWTYE